MTSQPHDAGTGAKRRDKHRYVSLSLDGASFICEPREVAAFLKDDPELTATDVWLTSAEFEALPDFAGF
jgi:hypothetical protein